MKNIFTALLAGSLFAAGFTAGAQSVKFIDEVSSWKQSKVACEKAVYRIISSSFRILLH